MDGREALGGRRDRAHREPDLSRLERIVELAHHLVAGVGDEEGVQPLVALRDVIPAPLLARGEQLVGDRRGRLREGLAVGDDLLEGVGFDDESRRVDLVEFAG